MAATESSYTLKAKLVELTNSKSFCLQKHKFYKTILVSWTSYFFLCMYEYVKMHDQIRQRIFAFNLYVNCLHRVLMT